MSNPGLVFALSPPWGSCGKSNLFLFVGKPIFYLWTNLFDFQFLVNRIYLEIPLFSCGKEPYKKEVGRLEREIINLGKSSLFLLLCLFVFLSRLFTQINVLEDTGWHLF